MGDRRQKQGCVQTCVFVLDLMSLVAKTRSGFWPQWIKWACFFLFWVSTAPSCCVLHGCAFTLECVSLPGVWPLFLVFFVLFVSFFFQAAHYSVTALGNVSLALLFVLLMYLETPPPHLRPWGSNYFFISLWKLVKCHIRAAQQRRGWLCWLNRALSAPSAHETRSTPPHTHKNEHQGSERYYGWNIFPERGWGGGGSGNKLSHTGIKGTGGGGGAGKGRGCNWGRRGDEIRGMLVSLFN